MSDTDTQNDDDGENKRGSESILLIISVRYTFFKSEESFEWKSIFIFSRQNGTEVRTRGGSRLFVGAKNFFQSDNISWYNSCFEEGYPCR